MSDYEDYSAVIKLLNTDDASRHVRRKHRLPAECYSLSDCEYFFTLCARHQGTPFRDVELSEAVVNSLLWRKQRHQWKLYTLCLMPDHLHFLLSPESHELRYVNSGTRGILPEGILNQVAGFKSFTTTQVWWKQGGKGPLWQRSNSLQPVHSARRFVHSGQPGSERPCEAMAGLPVFTHRRPLVGNDRRASPNDSANRNGGTPQRAFPTLFRGAVR
jgi:REP element-mobilizing transposase RayT